MEASDVFWELHHQLPKQGPGSDESTRRALGMVPDLASQPRILDLGCGPGRQSLVLAQETGGHVTAVDLLDRFLEEVSERSQAAGLGDHITSLRADMLELPGIAKGSIDLIWCESAVYNVGFEVGLKSWRPLLADGGSVVVSECSWTGDDRPREAAEFWAEGYPAMVSVEENIDTAKRAGFECLGHFKLPLSDWTAGYYDILAERIGRIRDERGDDPEIATVLDAEEFEQAVVQRHHESFGYVFFVLQPN